MNSVRISSPHDCSLERLRVHSSVPSYHYHYYIPCVLIGQQLTSVPETSLESPNITQFLQLFLNLLELRKYIT